ncbi:hypothetical protein JVT61DRAFT_176 [Boletus reticuloceps]|uniref:Uncharacterized protein n=1 Tax=Boletus reticuloceps TaxID=495285 RepID=A0A8I2Z172_9AGAM|nr:hypothetical protein JVT61DRAFT_176 [Boletus reticuloceps]
MSALEENDVGSRPPLLATLPDPFQKEQTVLILVGLIASGKVDSLLLFITVGIALESYFPRFRRCNQDDLGNRQQVEELAYHTLREGRSPCVDRTNFNATYVDQTRTASLFMQVTHIGKATVTLERDRPRLPGNFYQHYCLRYPLSCENEPRQ